MRRGFLLPWVLLAVWTAWMCALQGLMPSSARVDLGVILLVALSARMSAEDLHFGALVAGLARSAVSIDPPVAILSGLLGVAMITAAARSVVDLRSPWMRAPLCALGAFALALWLSIVHAVRHPELAQAPFSDRSLLVPSAGAAFLTGLAALFLAPILERLPGLSYFDRGRPWAIAASRR
jgi:hypothetical protein